MTDNAITIAEAKAPASGFDVANWLSANVGPLAIIAEKYAKSGLVPAALANKPEAVFTVLTTGLELGLGPATSLRAIHVVQGRAVLSSDLMRGLAMKAGASFAYVTNTDKECRIRWTRGESGGEVSYTWADATTAKLTGKDNWKAYPAAMLAARCGAMAARQSAPDLLAGLYTPDEMEHVEPHAEATKPKPTRKPADPPKVVDVTFEAADDPPSENPAPADPSPPVDKNKLSRELWALAGELGLQGKRDVSDYPDSVVSVIYCGRFADGEVSDDPEIGAAVRMVGCKIRTLADVPTFVVGRDMDETQKAAMVKRLREIRNNRRDADDASAILGA